MLLVDGHDDAFLGVGCREPNEEEVAVYDVDIICQRLIGRDGMSLDEAREWYGTNIVGGFLGDRGPIFIERME